MSASVGLDAGVEMHAMAARLFPLHRAQTGEGVRETLRALRDWVPIEMHEVPSGTPVFDWEVPPEWRMHQAYIADRTGRRVVDVARSTLHLVNGSVPVRETMSWEALAPRLHTLPDHPDRVPYKTAFFRDEWDFCLSENDRAAIEAADLGPYEVVVDAEFVPGERGGSLTYGEFAVPGTGDEEMLISVHTCHPSLANDNLSGICVATMLARRLATTGPRRLGIRFVWLPATIGPIAWMATNRGRLERIRHGLVLTLLGDAHPLTYKRSHHTDAPVDRAAEHVLATRGEPYAIDPFVPWGYDERQYSSPGVNLAMGCLMRSRPGGFDEYHTSADDMSFIRPDALEGSLEAVTKIIDVLEHDATFENLKPFGEPRLGQHGLYHSLPEDADLRSLQQAVQWVLNRSDGHHSLLDIAERAALPFETVRDAAERLEACDLLRRL